MRNLTHPPGNRSVISESFITLVAIGAALFMSFIYLLAGLGRDLLRAVMPETRPKLAFAGGSRHGDDPPRPVMHTHAHARAENSDNLMTMIKRSLARRSHRHGLGSARSSGQFGGGGRDIRKM